MDEIVIGFKFKYLGGVFEITNIIGDTIYWRDNAGVLGSMYMSDLKRMLRQDIYEKDEQ